MIGSDWIKEPWSWVLWDFEKSVSPCLREGGREYVTVVFSFYLMFFLHIWVLVKKKSHRSHLPLQGNIQDVFYYNLARKHVRITNKWEELLCFWLGSLVLVAFANGSIVMGYNRAPLVPAKGLPKPVHPVTVCLPEWHENTWQIKHEKLQSSNCLLLHY